MFSLFLKKSDRGFTFNIALKTLSANEYITQFLEYFLEVFTLLNGILVYIHVPLGGNFALIISFFIETI